MNLMHYRGFCGSIDVSLEDGCLFGKIEFIEPLINYEGQTIPELEAAFRAAVDDYLDTCRQLGIPPEPAFAETLEIPIGQELHREAAIAARRQGRDLAEFITSAIKHEIGQSRGLPVGENLGVMERAADSRAVEEHRTS